MFLYSGVSLMIGIVLDFLLGDPYWMPHPIRFIGSMISFFDKKLRNNSDSPSKQIFKGAILVILVIFISVLIPVVILYFLFKINVIVAIAVQSIMCYQIIATKALKDESMKVYNAIEKGSLEDSRNAVAMIVGRDTQSLDEKGVIKATVETIAENTADGAIAPIFYMFFGGAVLGFFYKAINTMDSMVGYKNDKYLYFGRCAAKLDDVANYIPARLSALFMIIASLVLRLDYKNAIKIYKRDKYKHKSPNSAHTEAVCAGALDICLAGDAYYFGKLVKKDTIGDDIRQIRSSDIITTNRLLYTTVILFSAVVLSIRWVVLLYGFI